MPEKEIEVKVVTVKYICDKCGEGEMLSTGMEFLTNPPIVPHKCNKCGDIRNFFDESYPHLKYIPVNLEDEFKQHGYMHPKQEVT